MFETNLPGSSIHVIDEYNQSVYDSSQFGTTESVLIIGTAFDGPTGKEVAVYNPEHAAYIFGGSYDPRARRSASLVAYAQDAYEKGCRTIYCMRVGGKEISKTYRLKEMKPVYFKLSGSFPSNKYKDMALIISEGKLTILKTANKATLEEKREGAVESSQSIIKVQIDINNGLGINANSRLSDLIEYVNGYIKNNVFKLSLVDEKGVDITYSEQVQDILVSALFDGLYTVGRIDKKVKADEEAKEDPKIEVESFTDKTLLKMTTNLKISCDYPYINGDDYKAFETFGGLDAISSPDQIDYEEVNMNSFELYKKLGSGFAQTAMLQSVGEGEAKRFTVKPTPSDDPRYSVEIGEGIYNIASNLKTDYRVLASGFADEKIIGKRPTQSDFLGQSLSKISVFKAKKFNDTVTQDALMAVYKLEDDNVKKFGFVSTRELPCEIASPDKLPTLQDVVASLDPELKTLSATIEIKNDKTYAIVEAEGAYWLAKSNGVIMPVASLYETQKDFIVSIKPAETDGIIYTIHVFDGFEEFTSISEFAEELANTPIGYLFNFVPVIGYENVLPVISNGADPTCVPAKIIGADENIVVPFTTSDNFARQLAQHCEYTSLKTYQTHGVIGVKPLIDTSIKAVSHKCDELVEKDYDLYVKNVVGRPVLGIDNMPYHIGKSITITTMQHTINTMDGYRFVASGQGAYVGRASTLPASTSTTNQIIPIAPHFTFGESQKVALNKKGYVTVEYKDGNYKITDGVTKAPIYSQFSRFATFRTMKLVDRVIRDATEPFIGKKNDMTNRNSMYTAIKSGMDSLLDRYLERYEFNMNYSKHDARLGEIKIDYTIDIINEIRNVKNTVTAKSE